MRRRVIGSRLQIKRDHHAIVEIFIDVHVLEFNGKRQKLDEDGWVTVERRNLGDDHFVSVWMKDHRILVPISIDGSVKRVSSENIQIVVDDKPLILSTEVIRLYENGLEVRGFKGRRKWSVWVNNSDPNLQTMTEIGLQFIGDHFDIPFDNTLSIRVIK